MDQRFSSVRHGYDPEQVDAFLVAIASRTEALEAELQQLRATPPPSVEDAAEGSTKRIDRYSDVAGREVEKLLVEIKAEAATIVAEARTEADRIAKDAQGVATRSVDEARAHLSQVEADARRIPSDIAERRQEMIEETRKMQERLVRIAEDLDLLLNPEGP